MAAIKLKTEVPGPRSRQGAAVSRLPWQVGFIWSTVYIAVGFAIIFYAVGWLRIGFSGHQPGVGERYIATGSVYLCAVGLLPLGLPPSDAFWLNPSDTAPLDIKYCWTETWRGAVSVASLSTPATPSPGVHPATRGATPFFARAEGR